MKAPRSAAASPQGAGLCGITPWAPWHHPVGFALLAGGRGAANEMHDVPAMLL